MAKSAGDSNLALASVGVSESIILLTPDLIFLMDSFLLKALLGFSASESGKDSLQFVSKTSSTASPSFALGATSLNLLDTI